METTYRKSPLGSEEIAQRKLQLPPRLRSLLIMVDGKRSVTDLAKLSPVPVDEALGALLSHGLIEPQPLAARSGSGGGSSSRSATAGPPTTAPTEAPATEVPVPDFPALRRDAARQLIDLTGPMGESLAIKMESAASFQALKPMLQMAAQLVKNTRGRQAAQDFLTRFDPA